MRPADFHGIMTLFVGGLGVPWRHGTFPSRLIAPGGELWVWEALVLPRAPAHHGRQSWAHDTAWGGFACLWRGGLDGWFARYYCSGKDTGIT